MVKPYFVHLSIHSDYSMVDGIIKIDQLIKKALLYNIPALAITDFTNLCGLIKFYRTAINSGIKPIVGSDFKIKINLLQNKLFKLTILAKNNIGYKNLITLISNSYKRGYGIDGPTIEFSWLIECKEGLIIILGNSYEEHGHDFINNNYELIRQFSHFFNDNFKNNFYLEITRIGYQNEEEYINLAIKLAINNNIPIVATNKVRFLNQEDFITHEIRVAINSGYRLENTKRPCNYTYNQYLRSEKEMCNIFSDIPVALINSVEIAKRCNVNLQLGKYFLPNFFTGNKSIKEFLVNKAYKGLEKRLDFLFPNHKIRIKKRQIYFERLNTELNMINKIGFPSYFLIVMEFIQWSKDNLIPVGPGRGSGAGSLVAYALKITDIDPLRFNLLFERFLNPERISMPDFDIDFCMDERDKVIEHITNIYGSDSVAQIITFGTMTAKAVIRDVGRVLGYPYGFVERISKMIPTDYTMTLEKAFLTENKLVELYKTDEDAKSIIDMARKLEGITRNFGKHAGGLVISPTKITDFTPIYCDEYGKNAITQFDKNDIEYIGLVKFDFLGLRTLTIINRAIVIINANKKQLGKSLIDITNIPLDDRKSFYKLQQANTIAIFQLESRGMRELIKRLKPDCFEDMIALIALFRPGPLKSGMVDNFIQRKHGREKIYYPDKNWQHISLKPILKSTYGIILYQEQVMQIAQILAGYSLGKADILRRAMGKKQPIEMAKQRLFFQQGSKKLGIDEKLSIKIFDLLEKFAHYGFNKSHSVAYALVSYQTLWLKTHYPAEFMSATLTTDMDNTERLVILINECRRIGIKVLPPNINSGSYQFHVNQKGKILYGMGAIKGIGKNIIDIIIKERNKNGIFIDLFDLCNRIDIKKINQRIIKKLILSGSCDDFPSHRRAMIYSLTDIINAVIQNSRTMIHKQIDMFPNLVKKSEIISQFNLQIIPWSELDILEKEYESLGLYLTNHPINLNLQEIKYYNNNLWIKNIKKTNKFITLVGLLISIRIFFTKKGQKIGICCLEDHSGQTEIILFQDILEKYNYLLKKNNILIVKGKINYDSVKEIIRIIVFEIMELEEARKKYVSSIVVNLKNEQITKNILDKIKQYLNLHHGNLPLYIYYTKIDKQIKFKLNKIWYISLSNSLIKKLQYLLGFNQVELKFN